MTVAEEVLRRGWKAEIEAGVEARRLEWRPGKVADLRHAAEVGEEKEGPDGNP